MLTLSYFVMPQTAEDLFTTVAGLNNAGVMASFRAGLCSTREHMVSALAEVLPGGDHETLCYHFQVSCSLLMSILDGIAVFVAKKVAVPPMAGIVYWKDARTFVDPRFAELQGVQQATVDRVIKGGISADALRNFAKHYMPWIVLASMGTGDTSWDVRFPIDGNLKSGPVIKGLRCPLFNDACNAYYALGQLLGVDTTVVIPM